MPIAAAAVRPPVENRLPPEPVARAAAAAADARAAANDAPPPYPTAGAQRRPQVGNDDITVYTILMATGTTLDLPSVDEVRRAYALAAAHRTTPRKIQNLILDLATAADAPRRPHHMPNADRRLALGALMGIRVGFNPKHAQEVVDSARSKDKADIAKFIAEEMAVATGVALNVYGAYLVGTKAVAGVTAKGAAIKAGGLGVLGTAKAGVAVTGWIGLGIIAGIWGAGSFYRGGQVAGQVAEIYGDLLEPTWFQDRRILAGLMDGEVVTDHPVRAMRRGEAE